MYGDLSGLVTGKDRRISSAAAFFHRAIMDASAWTNGLEEKLLFGTDWPLARMTVYRNFVEKVIPKRWQSQVLRQNALKLFNFGP